MTKDNSSPALEQMPSLYKEIVDGFDEGVYVVDRDRRIVYWNKGAERMTGYAATEVVGRHCADNILVHVNEQGENLCVTGCPLSGTMATGKPAETQIYLHHKDGHRMPVKVRASPVRNELGTVVGAVETFIDLSDRVAIEQHVDDLRKLAMLDELTGLANRRYVDMILRSRLDEHQRYGWQLGVIFADIDKFKAVNDTYGHAVGDRVLRMVAQTLVATSRSSDLVGRLGGEEFVTVLASIDTAQLLRVADRYRALVQQSSVRLPERRLSVTLSVGATLAVPEDTVDTLLARADELMYRSKQGGRNRVSSDVAGPAPR